VLGLARVRFYWTDASSPNESNMTGTTQGQSQNIDLLPDSRLYDGPDGDPWAVTLQQSH